MPRVLVNFPARALGQALARLPDHRLYGVSHFATRGYDLVGPDVPIRGWPDIAEARFAPRAQGAMVGPGSKRRGTRRSFLTLARSADVVFTHVDVLGLTEVHALRAARLLPTPVVTLMHSPPFTRGGRLHRPAWWPLLRGSDALPCMSAETAAALEERRDCRGKVSVARLGPDRAFPVPPPDYPGHGVVSIGRTLRDLDTLVRACDRAAVPCTIVCPAKAAAALPDHSDGVTVVVPARGQMPYAEVLETIARARVVAIPLRRSGLLAGHWSLLDALMVGKPVVITARGSCGIDVEAEQIGVRVDPGDVDGWARALGRLCADPQAAAVMGRRARSLVDGGLDSRGFADAIMDVFDRLLGTDTRRNDARPGGGVTPPLDGATSRSDGAAPTSSSTAASHV